MLRVVLQASGDAVTHHRTVAIKTLSAVLTGCAEVINYERQPHAYSIRRVANNDLGEIVRLDILVRDQRSDDDQLVDALAILDAAFSAAPADKQYEIAESLMLRWGGVADKLSKAR